MIKQTNYKEVFEGRDDKILRLSAPFAFQTPSHQRMKRPSLYSITMAREKKMGGGGGVEEDSHVLLQHTNSSFFSSLKKSVEFKRKTKQNRLNTRKNILTLPIFFFAFDRKCPFFPLAPCVCVCVSERPREERSIVVL